MKALVALTVGSPFLIIAPHREITPPDSAGVLATGLWKPGCSTVEAEPSHGASRQELEEGCGGGWLLRLVCGVTSLWPGKETSVGRKASA